MAEPASRNSSEPLKARGIGRVKSESGGGKYDDWTLELYFDRKPTDDEMRRIHDLLSDGAAVSERGLTAGFSDETVANVRAWMVANIDAEKDDDNPESVRLLEKIAALLCERPGDAK